MLQENFLSVSLAYVFYSNDNIKPLLIKLPNLNGICTKRFEEKVKHNSLMAIQKHEKILSWYLNIWNEIKELIMKDLDVEKIYKNKDITTKIKPCIIKLKLIFMRKDY